MDRSHLHQPINLCRVPGDYVVYRLQPSIDDGCLRIQTLTLGEQSLIHGVNALIQSCGISHYSAQVIQFRLHLIEPIIMMFDVVANALEHHYDAAKDHRYLDYLSDIYVKEI